MGREGADALYRALVAAARDPAWYVEAGIPDTVDGRFDMIAAFVALALNRIGEGDRKGAALLIEAFIADMDGNLRQLGVGDLKVGKEVARLVGALGGRSATLKEALAEGDLEGWAERNLFRGTPPDKGAPTRAAKRLREASEKSPLQQQGRI